MPKTIHLKLHINRPFLVLAVLLIFLISMTGGCSNKPTGQMQTGAPELQTVIDCAGRQVKVPINPQRIACLCPEAGHALAMYGKGSTIVAAVGGMQRDKLLVEMYPHIAEVPVPKNSGVINIEELAAAAPELVFIKEDTVNNEAEMEKLAKARIPVIAIKFNTMEEQLYALQVIAQVVGAESEWQRYKEFYQTTLDLVQERVKLIPDSERVRIYHSINEATRTDSEGTLPAEWTRAAGVINVSIDQELKVAEGKYYASIEQILLWDPDYILVNDPNVVGYIMNHEHWRPLQAVKNNRVLPLPNGLTRWGHFSSLETPLAVLWTAKTVYPQHFQDVDMRAVTRDFYKQFFAWELDETTIDKILSGQDMRGARS